MNTLRVIVISFMLISGVSFAFEKCPSGTSGCNNTSLGKLEFIWGMNSPDKQSHILLNGKEIFKNNSDQIGW
ncbi:hypothetical protein [Lelliottia amnigena]|uniref:hypothetical protein n=1 Tax=Lelliottia amnigena TaxID=61646 RepID=UPI001ED961D7|nr:hypothetical protein [Lelliottia amnigena]